MKLSFRVTPWLPFLTIAAIFGIPSLFAQGWQTLPNTSLQSVCPPDNFQPAGGGMPPYHFSRDCHYVIDGWNSAIADTKRNRLIIWGGGHVAYFGNEVYSLNLGLPTPTMTRLNDPSVFSLKCEQNADGAPLSVHTWGSLVYLPKADKMFQWDGRDYCGGEQRDVYLLDLATLKWQNMRPSGYDMNQVNSVEGAYCALDPTSANESVVCILANYMLFRYDAVENSWTRLTRYGQWTTQHGGNVVVDPTRKLLFEIGADFSGTAPGGKIYSIDLSKPTYDLKDWTPETTGCEGLVSAPYPGLVWDPTINRIVGYPNTGDSVYIFDPATKTCVMQTYPGGPRGSESQNYHGIFGRFNYFPSLGKYVVVNNNLANAHTLTLNGAGGSIPTPPADTFPPTVSITAPAAGSTVSGTVTITATATDNIGVGSVQFTLNGVNLGAPVTTSPYSMTWNTADAAQGDHALAAVAQDLAGNTATAAATTVTVAGGTPPPQPPLTTATGIPGLGQSTITCLDKDGDRHGVGPGCAGPDADDNDSAIHTGPEAIGKHGSLTSFLAHLGYNPTRLWFIAPATATPPGNNATGAVNDPSRPFADWSRIATQVAAGDLVLLRGGEYSFSVTGIAKVGTQERPLIFMSYPGEQAFFNAPGSGIDCVNASNIVLDGLKFFRNGSNAGVPAGNNDNAVFRRIDSSGNEWGIVASDITNFLIEDSVFHDNAGGGGQHGIYLANHKSTPSNNVTVRRNILFNNDYTGFQFNGKVTNMVVEQNLSYNNTLSGFSWLSGVSHSIFRGNVAFNNGQAGLTINNYTDFCIAYEPDGVGTTCPYDQNYNLIENFTSYNTGKDRDGAPAIASQAAIRVANTAQNKPGDLGHNIFRNIIGVAPTIGNQYQPIVFLDTDKDYLATSVFENILGYQLDTGTGTGTAVIGFGYSKAFGYEPYTCAEAQKITTISNCISADPQFVSADVNYWNSPTSFDLRLRSSSPAAHAGTPVGAPTYDILGYPFANPPSMGAYEVVSSPSGPPTAAAPCDINGDGVVDSKDVQAATSQALRQVACGTADLQKNGQCTVVGVQRVISAALGGACVVGQ